MDVCFDACLAVPAEGAVSKVDMNIETVIKWFPYSRHLLSLRDRVSRYKGCTDVRSFHESRCFELPTGNIVNFTCRFIGFAFFINID